MREKYETKLQDIQAQREAQREEVRKNMETKIEEMQRRAKEHADGKRDLVNLNDERIIEIKDD